MQILNACRQFQFLQQTLSSPSLFGKKHVQFNFYRHIKLSAPVLRPFSPPLQTPKMQEKCSNQSTHFAVQQDCGMRESYGSAQFIGKIKSPPKEETHQPSLRSAHSFSQKMKNFPMRQMASQEMLKTSADSRGKGLLVC